MADQSDRKPVGPLIWLLRRLPLGRGRRVVISVLALLASIGSIVAPLIYGVITNIVADAAFGVASMDWSLLGGLLIGQVVLFAMVAACNLQCGLMLNRAVVATSAHLRTQVAALLPRLGIDAAEKTSRGELVSKATAYIDSATTLISPVFVSLPTNALTAISVTVILFWLSPLLAVIILVAAPVSAVISLLVARRARPHLVQQWTATAALSGHIEETLSTRRMLKAYGAQSVVGKRFTELNDGLYTSMKSAQWTSGSLAPILTAVNTLVFLSIAVVGGMKVIDGSLSLGAVQAVVLLSGLLGSSVRELASFITRIQSGSVSAGRIRDLLDTPIEDDPAVDAPVPAIGRHRLPPRIEFDAVDFAYEPGDPVLCDVTFTVGAGTTTAIVGSTGSGKTTLSSLLQAFHRPDSGAVRIDGVDVNDLGRAGTRSMIAAVTQEPWLHHGSVHDNIAFGLGDRGVDGEPLERDVVEAIDESHMSQIVAMLPDGVDTVVGQDAVNLSRGEQQLITVARAIAAQPQILVLDEATSAADPHTELLIQRALHRLRSRTTALVITHRMATAALADQIVVLEGGRVVEVGDHETLLARGGVYAARCGRRVRAEVEESDASPSGAHTLMTNQ